MLTGGKKSFACTITPTSQDCFSVNIKSNSECLPNSQAVQMTDVTGQEQVTRNKRSVSFIHLAKTHKQTNNIKITRTIMSPSTLTTRSNFRFPCTTCQQSSYSAVCISEGVNKQDTSQRLEKRKKEENFLFFCIKFVGFCTIN